MKTVRKAVFPVAGLGTRFLPATKAQPKEMLPVVDKPLIQYAVEEAVAAGVTELVFITGRNKRAIEDHFDAAHELEAQLEADGKTQLLEALRGTIPRNIHCIFIRQPAPLGLGHAVLCARPVIGDEPFAILLADDLMDVDQGVPPVMAQMTQRYAQEGVSMLAVQEVPRAETRQYGIVSSEPYRPHLERMRAIVEKPAPESAPSTLAVAGRYLLTPRVFEHLARIEKGAGGEIQLTDGIAALLQEEPVLAHRFDGRRYDCGSKLGYLQATVAMALKHPEVGEEFGAYLRGRQ
ncbi:MAG TPA: UTP--glucose-1-phosphate uridylyltransferase GalU [Noviherbaspirillum sp.]|jgi:UTP--glucose-1-phosphate uridylyltransferase|uniref:UTP--glucose-1-phosphate uridylyltransferase GalU n=1 Tax=Noviherbaspirillum sp. TaxID=1926288 RepID=UPI002F94DAE8